MFPNIQTTALTGKTIHIPFKTFFFLTLLMFTHCNPKSETPKSYESDILKIQPLSNSIFTHISYLETNDFGKVACNGMVYFNGDEAIVFDTPVDNKTSEELIRWIEEEQKKKIVAVVITHFHGDCLGGLDQFHANGTESYASQRTMDLIEQNKVKKIPQHIFEQAIEIKVGKEPVFVRFFGEGHTMDNVVGYVSSEKALFGGCLVKSVNANKGNLEDANTQAWSQTIENIKAEYPDVNIVIPGHGKSGGIELLDYTMELFANID